MNTKKLTAILIAIAFGLVVLISCVGLLLIKKVDISYAVSIERNDTDEIQKKFDEYLGKNLLFLDTNEVIENFKSEPYLEIVAVEKKYPNVLRMDIRERKETYRIQDGNKAYVIDENGYVLNDTGVCIQNKKVIDLNFEHVIPNLQNSPNFLIQITNATLGEKIQTNNDGVFYKVLNISKKVGLSDCIDSIKIIDYTNGFDVFYETQTGVELRIIDLEIDGEKKALIAFDKYNTIATDYQKRFGEIWAMYQDVSEPADNVYDTLVIKHIFNEEDCSLYYEQIIN